jgi:hypothetical protein
LDSAKFAKRHDLLRLQVKDLRRFAFLCFQTREPSAVRHRAMIELPYFLWARPLTQLGSLEFHDMVGVHEPKNFAQEINK